MASNPGAQAGENADNQENRDPSQEEGTIKRMFEEGTTAIATHRHVLILPAQSVLCLGKLRQCRLRTGCACARTEGECTW